MVRARERAGLPICFRYMFQTWLCPIICKKQNKKRLLLNLVLTYLSSLSLLLLLFWCCSCLALGQWSHTAQRREEITSMDRNTSEQKRTSWSSLSLSPLTCRCSTAARGRLRSSKSPRRWGARGGRCRQRRHTGCTPSCLSSWSPRTLHTASQRGRTYGGEPSSVEVIIRICRISLTQSKDRDFFGQ